MLSIKYIRENFKLVNSSLSSKRSNIDLKELINLDSDRRNYLKEVEKLRAKKNLTSDHISHLKKKGEDPNAEISSMQRVSVDIKKIEKKLKIVEELINEKIYYIPNLVHHTVPAGKDEKDNVIIREWGQKPKLDFKILDHGKCSKV